jgi:hypothetical protein
MNTILQWFSSLFKLGSVHNCRLCCSPMCLAELWEPLCFSAVPCLISKMKRHVSAVRGDALSNPCVAIHGGGAQGHNPGVLPGGGIAWMTSTGSMGEALRINWGSLTRSEWLLLPAYLFRLSGMIALCVVQMDFLACLIFDWNMYKYFEIAFVLFYMASWDRLWDYEISNWINIHLDYEISEAEILQNCLHSSSLTTWKQSSFCNPKRNIKLFTTRSLLE